MHNSDWLSFLKQWNDEMLGSSLAEQLPQDIRESGWLGIPPATDSEIADVERKLKIALPPSYREFLKVSNGWRQTTFAIERVFGTKEICWFRKKHRDWIAAYAPPPASESREEISDSEYFSYENPEVFRYSHLKETLQISEVGDSAVYLLNPQVITKDGEWEAWFFANWIPGVRRFRSFIEMMQAEYSSFAGDEWKQPTGLIGELPDEYVGSPGSVKRHIKKRTKPRERKMLGRRLSDWTVEELAEMLRNTDDWKLRREIADVLGMLGDVSAIETLMGMMYEDSCESVSAIYALKKLAPERLTEPLLKLLKERHFFAFGAVVFILAEWKEYRAVPILVEVMKDTRPEAKLFAGDVGRQIALFGQVGCDALVELLKNDQPIVRQRAVVGLYYSNSPDTREVFEDLLNDPDQIVRERASESLSLLPPKRKQKKQAE
jgi:hypothetical protein